MITGLTSGVTYYFRVWTRDENGDNGANFTANWSDISNGATVYCPILGPGNITTLTALTGAYGRTVKLSWTAPGYADYTGNITNGRYAIQNSTYVAGVIWSTTAAQVVFTTTTAQGAWQTRAVTSLTPGVTYYFQVWTMNQDGYWSGLSNRATCWAQVVILSVTLSPTTYYHFGLLPTAISSGSVNSLGVVNSGNVAEDYYINCTNSLNWNAGSGAGNDTFLLRAAFHPTKPSVAAFDTYSNRLSNTDVLSSGSRFTIDATQTGAGVDPFVNDSRSLWLNFNTPLATSTSASQNITVTITSQESQ